MQAVQQRGGDLVDWNQIEERGQRAQLRIFLRAGGTRGEVGAHLLGLGGLERTQDVGTEGLADLRAVHGVIPRSSRARRSARKA